MAPNLTDAEVNDLAQRLYDLCRRLGLSHVDAQSFVLALFANPELRDYVRAQLRGHRSDRVH